MKTVAFVPIKLYNERTPGKNVKKFYDGIPLITYSLKNLLGVSGIDEIYVFCSDESIKSYLIDGVGFLKRPEYLDTKDATPQDIIREFIKLIEADIYMVHHVTSPFVSKGHFERCIEAVKKGGYDSAFTAEKVQKLLWSEKGEAVNFNPEDVPRTQDLPLMYSEVSAAYVFAKQTFLKYNRRIGEKPYIVEVSGAECVDIDYPEDFEIANAVYKEIISPRRLEIT